MPISKALGRAAKQAGMSEIQIAAAVGVTQQAVRNWLSGDSEPRGSTLLALISLVPGFGECIGLKAIAS